MLLLQKIFMAMKRFLPTILALLCFSLQLSAQSKLSVSILGDSYSTYVGYLEPDTNSVWYWGEPNPKSTDVTSVRQTWWHRFIKENGYRLCVNNSFSGSTVCNTGYNSADYSDRSFITRLNRLGSPDIIFVFGATNDSWAGAPIGEYKYADWTKEELYSFRPAMAYLMENLIDHYPNVRIYFLLNSELKDEIDESVMTICEHYSIPCIELTDIEKISGHPSVKGMEQIKVQIEAFLAKEGQ